MDATAWRQRREIRLLPNRQMKRKKTLAALAHFLVIRDLKDEIRFLNSRIKALRKDAKKLADKNPK